MKKTILTLMILTGFASLASAQTAEQIYNSIQSDELSVVIYSQDRTPLIGATLEEKSEGDLICQKTGAVVPNPVYTYECFSKLQGFVDAEKMYESLNVDEAILSFSSEGSVVVGLSVSQKSIDNLFCRQFIVVSSNPVSEYECFVKSN